MVLTAPRHLDGLRMASRQRPDLILLEAQFKGLDGLEVAETLRQAPKQKTVLMPWPNDGSLLTRFRAIQLGALDYMQKPLEGRKLAPESRQSWIA